MTSTPTLYDVAISGGGMVGMSLAVMLARGGVRVALIEKTPMRAQLEPSFDGRVSAIAYGSRRILEAAGVWADMARYGEPILDIRVSDGNTPFFVHYDHSEVGDAPLGHIVENRYIRHALHKAVAQYPNLTIVDETTLAGFESDAAGVTVRLADRPELRCRLLVAADGKNSQARKLAGIGATEWGYKQTAIVCTIVHSKPHDGLAQERFLPAGPFAVLPMTSIKPSPLEGEGRVGGRNSPYSQTLERGESTPPPNPPPQGGRGMFRSSLVWVEPQDRVGLYLELPDEECAQEIRERVGGYLGDITLAGPRFAYPLTLMHAKSYIGERLALIGDAAHAIHPIAGQGINLGFRDVGVLSELILKRFQLGLDIGDAETLAHYQRWRRFDNITMLAVTDGLTRLFSNGIVPLQLARGLGLWAVEKMPPLKRLFMRHAMGLVGDLPDVLKDDAAA